MQIALSENTGCFVHSALYNGALIFCFICQVFVEYILKYGINEIKGHLKLTFTGII